MREFEFAQLGFSSFDPSFFFEPEISYVAMTASKVLQGEMFKMTLNKPKNGNAQHLRVATVFPLSSVFRPVIETLREKYGVRVGS